MLNANVDEIKMLRSEASCYTLSTKHNLLVTVEFETLEEYLYLLEASAKHLAVLQERVCLYLAAAVSDFYIPGEKVSAK